MFPFRHSFCPNVYWQETWPEDGIGEVHNGQRSWRRGDLTPFSYLGLFQGEPSWFSSGQPISREPLTIVNGHDCESCVHCWTGPFGYLPLTLRLVVPGYGSLDFERFDEIFVLEVPVGAFPVGDNLEIVVQCNDVGDGSLRLWATVNQPGFGIIYDQLIAPISTHPVVFEFPGLSTALFIDPPVQCTGVEY